MVLDIRLYGRDRYSILIIHLWVRGTKSKIYAHVTVLHCAIIWMSNIKAL